MKHDVRSTWEHPRISCIIPAYNEQSRIGAVISVVTAHPLIDEVIVVDDGSTDATVRVAQDFQGAVLLQLPRNGGKTNAVRAGLAQATGDFILFVDADLEGLNGNDLTALVAPVLRGDADMSMSLRRNAPWLWRRIGIDYISGERVIPAALVIERMDELGKLPRFGFETWLNGICVAAKSRIAVVPWEGVDSPAKVRKHGFPRGILADISMLLDLFRSASALQLLHQIISMRRQRIRG